MSVGFERITREALALEPDEKAALAQTLLDTLGSTMDPKVEAAWVAEAERRYEALKAGNVDTVSAEEAFANARHELKWFPFASSVKPSGK